jgi:phenylalanyl-tRNA synthetase beta chain
MKVPVGWLKEYVELTLPIEELARQLVFTSCEVDRITRRGVGDTAGNYGHFVVGKVLEAEKHPNADKLQLTKVDTGDGEPRSIVCGAWNFGAGATVAVVTPGATMPGDFKIEKRKLRGEVSDGMILSERELELGTDHGGIMLLAGDLDAGTPLADVLPLGDDVLEIETLYNRPDLTSIYGIAREVAALTGAELQPVPGTDPARDGDETFALEIDDFDACPRFIARVFRDVTIGESPAWLKARLMGAGMRPISNVVDITNYVMLALGSPLHAYDADTLRGGIVVRRAQPGEKLVTLDGTSRDLDPADLVIADHERPIGLAGVMGGENTEVSASTTSVVLETANFEPLTVIRSGERHRMRSESQTRWEKGVDPEAAALAATYASQLLSELTGARWTGETELRAQPAEPTVIAYRPQYANATVGLEIVEDEQRERLERLGFEVTDN